LIGVLTIASYNTLVTGSLALCPFSISISDYSHHSSLVLQIEVSFEISLDFKASKKRA